MTVDTDLPSLQPDIEKPVVENAEFSLFYRATLGSHELLYGAQIDGMLATSGKVSDPPVNADHETNLNYLRNNDYVELKTNREIEYRRQEENFKRNKMLKCWCQCYLAGLKGLIVGYRNDFGIIQRLQWFDTNDIVRYCHNVWSPRTAIEFLDYFLSFIKKSFKDHVQQVLGINSNFREIGPITLRFDVDVNKRINVSETTETILPDWFVEARKKGN
ncbi:decapping and exoribonuclease protein-like isoform X3 [Pectinophora gossypiella]|uniref:decapping and exoribonuclease protein-like isoform X3 n=1 Tax=Pectinophora gossypiella TaxID=13191 RepID=UPI00214E7811|nr:decapping and exoribonuclease protein-like isoform X3 [Pectinophora gossypiella]